MEFQTRDLGLTRDTPPLLLAMSGDKVQQSAVTVNHDRLALSIAVPAVAEVAKSSDHLDFALRTFTLSSNVPRDYRRAEQLQACALDRERKSTAVQISFPVRDSGNCELQLGTICKPKILDVAKLNPKDPDVDALNLALTVLERNFPAGKTYGHAKKVGLAKGLALARSHADFLVSKFLLEQDVPHFFHSSVDGHSARHVVAIDDPESYECAYLGFPLQRIDCYLNVVQFAHFLDTGDALFQADDLAPIAEDINTLFQDSLSLERKKVVASVIEDLGPQRLPRHQDEGFQKRRHLLSDHITHSAPLPEDAWKILLSTAVPGHVRDRVVLHAAQHPHYANLLLEDLNAREVWGKTYTLKEHVDPKGKTLSLSIGVDGDSNGNSAKELKVRYTNFFLDRHQLHLQAIQEIVGFQLLLPEFNQPFPYINAGFVNVEKVEGFLDREMYPLIDAAGVEMSWENEEIGNYKFVRVTFVDQENRRTYSYETAPFRYEARNHATLEAFNYIYHMLKQFGFELSDRDSIFEYDGDDFFKDTGIEDRFYTVAMNPRTKVSTNAFSVPLLDNCLAIKMDFPQIRAGRKNRGKIDRIQATNRAKFWKKVLGVLIADAK